MCAVNVSLYWSLVFHVVGQITNVKLKQNYTYTSKHKTSLNVNKLSAFHNKKSYNKVMFALHVLRD